MHSSRMRTGRSLTVCQSLLRGSVWSGGVSARGCLLWGVSARGGLVPGGSALGGVSGPGGCLLWGVGGGVWSQGGVGIPACTEADTPPVNRMTDTCKNITLAQLRCGR